MGFDVSEVIRDAGESAKSLQRPGMAKILEGVRGGSIGRVVVLKLDRLTRSTRDLADLLDLFAKADAALVSVSENLDTASACGRLVLNVIGSVAQWEREAIAERTSTALAHKRQRRAVYGATPFGFVRVGDALFRSRESRPPRGGRADGSFRPSFSEIATRLTELGVMPHRGKAWHASAYAPCYVRRWRRRRQREHMVLDLFDAEPMAARRRSGELTAIADWPS